MYVSLCIELSKMIKVLEEPERNPKSENYSLLHAWLRPKYIEVLKEEEAYSLDSLVADSGGVLGLFIGFNFLMIWEWIVGCIKLLSRWNIFGGQL